MAAGRERGFEQLATDRVSLIKKDGARTDGIKAIVNSEKISIPNGNLPIEEGDTIERVRPGGFVDTYTVLDTGYSEGIRNAIPAHFTLKVHKENAIPRSIPSPTSTTTYNLTGANPRVNNNSLDNSVNIATTQTTTTIFNDMRSALDEITDEEDREVLRARIDEMEEAHGTSSFLEKYKAFMELAANNMTVFLPFLPLLARMITR